MVYGFNEDKSKALVPSMTDFEATLVADGSRDNMLIGHESRISGLEQAVSTLSRITGEDGVDVSIADLIYPVGAIYISTSNADPSSLFGGTWVRITGKFLLAGTNGGAEGGNGTAEVAPGGTGGEASVTLSAAQSGVAPHGHGFTQPQTPSLSHSITQPAFTLPSHVHKNVHGHGAPLGGNDGATKLSSTKWGSAQSNSAWKRWGPWWGSGYEASFNVTIPNYTGNTGAPTSTPNCTRTTNVAVAAHAAASCTGGAVSNHAGAAASQAHNNMPPYLSVYVWERTA